MGSEPKVVRLPLTDVVQVAKAQKAHEFFKPDTFELTFGSPPYLDRRTYGENMDMGLKDWLQMMMDATLSCLRVTSGAVVWVVSGTGGLTYTPGPEALVYTMRLLHPEVNILRPCIWAKNSPPTGSGWYSNDWEYCLAFSNKPLLPAWDPEALQEVLKYTSGGSFRQRKKNGDRSAGSAYPTHKFRKRPSNVFWAEDTHEAPEDWNGDLHYVPVGGGLLGWKDCHLNEAPFPEKLVARFVKTLTNPGGLVFDPFCGSGTTLDVAYQLGRVGYGFDLRESQVALTKRRLTEMHPELFGAYYVSSQ